MQNRCRGDLGESNANLTLDSHESSGDLCDSHNLNADDFGILVAKCGKTIGLKGEIRLIIYSDFDEIFTKGNVFLARDTAHDSRHTKQTTTRHCGAFERSENNEAIHESKNGWLLRFARKSCGLPRLDCVKSRNDGFFLTLKSFNPHKKSATFDEIQSIDDAKNLTSLLLYSSESLSQKYCALGENEHFWFEIIGMCVVENDETIGIVSDIERIGSVDYLIVAVSAEICAKYPHIKAKKFYIPYISRYILQTDKSKNTIFTQDSLGILENS
ncbi:ribosome maturation factor RimM [Helicobacter sp. 23-1044]